MTGRSLSLKTHNWYEKYRIPPADAISEGHDYYITVRNAKVHRFPYRNPSADMCREILSILSRMYDDWDKTFSEIGRPYDLQLWIFDTHFVDCQLVCTPVDKPGDKRDNYFYPCPEQYLFPVEKYPQYGNFDPEQFEWTVFEVRSYLFEQADHLSERRIRKLLKNGWRQDNALLQGRERAFWHIYDFVWVGRKLRV
jgi:hypothetical protein